MRRIGIAEFKARLSEYIRYVRRGNVLTILDRETAVAQLAPLEQSAAITIRKPAATAPKLREVRIPRAQRAKRDPVRVLIEDRERGR